MMGDISDFKQAEAGYQRLNEELGAGVPMERRRFSEASVSPVGILENRLRRHGGCRGKHDLPEPGGAHC
jgi:hypothetical protein